MNIFRIDIEQSIRSAQASAARGGSINAADGVSRRLSHSTTVGFPARLWYVCTANISRTCGDEPYWLLFDKPLPPLRGKTYAA